MTKYVDFALSDLVIRTFFLRTRVSDFPKIKNNLSLVLEKLRTKTHFSLK